MRRREIYKRNRYKVEQVIGIVKSRFGDRDKTKDFHVASLYFLARFVLYNLIIPLERILFSFYAFLFGLSFINLMDRLLRFFFQQAPLTLIVIIVFF
jgi:hypothetical protein